MVPLVAFGVSVAFLFLSETMGAARYFHQEALKIEEAPKKTLKNQVYSVLEDECVFMATGKYTLAFEAGFLVVFVLATQVPLWM